MTVENLMNSLTYDGIKTKYESKGYKFFDKGDFNVNIFGFRLTVSTNAWDDCIGIAYRENGVKKVVAYKASTDPGMYYLNHPMNSGGTAILKEGQYRGSHKIRLHAGRYEALGQCGWLKLFRDGDLDNEHDFDPESITDSFGDGINIHHGYNSWRVEKNSAGCQVIKMVSDFNEFMDICRNAAAIWGNKFSYTLFDESQK